MSTIPVGSTVEIRFDFIYDGVLVDPDTLTGEIFKDDILDSTFNATFISTGRYSLSWVPAESGYFEIRLTGEFTDETPDLIHYEYFIIGGLGTKYSLGETETIYMLGELSPLYVDPEIILVYYPDGDLIEITEIVWRKSLELEEKIGIKNLTHLTQLQCDFIIAATMCELSRIYGRSSTFGEFGGAESFKLGDLEVTRGGDNGGSSGNGEADTWCELAALLKIQLASFSDNMKPVVPGSAYPRKIISRDLKSPDYCYGN